MAFGAPSLKGRALRLLSQREHSRVELERKLARHEEEPGSLARALDELAANAGSEEAKIEAEVKAKADAKAEAKAAKQQQQPQG